MEASPPPAQYDPYNQSAFGYYGELGSGANARIKFVQSAITHEDLDRITLIQNIPGSETWDVRDLFQRDVDVARVTRDLLPYFKDSNRVKYFNPLTFVLLPLADGLSTVEKELPTVVKSEIEKNNHKYTLYEVPELFRFSEHIKYPQYSSVHWNDRRVRVVAIDGQHRLSALKRWKDDPEGCGACRAGLSR